ncbi:MAG: hypothetical protein A2Y17_04130 [Clostridiales bacterium GWF2_38_85]|nr:MAG: hypothetical protein A2Y17_04130 [Clostridiales bacterium GWF2_38_85]HBL83458.1 hypothetical protein [Clostridiales bacterium]
MKRPCTPTDILDDIDDFYESLDNAGIELEGEIKNLTPTYRGFNSSVGTNGTQKTTESTYTVEIGDDRYQIKIYTLEDNGGFGITGFTIDKFKNSESSK